MNQFHYLPKDVKDIVIGYTGPPKRWAEKSKDILINLLKVGRSVDLHYDNSDKILDIIGNLSYYERHMKIIKMLKVGNITQRYIKNFSYTYHILSDRYQIA